MKTLLKSLIIISVVFLGAVLIESCIFCNCKKQKVENLNFYKLQLTNQKTLPQDTLLKYYPLDSDSVLSTEYSIELGFEMEKIASNLNWSDFSLFNKAYACKCNEDYSVIHNKILKLDIITIHDFNAEYLAGDTVTNLFVSKLQKYNPTSVGNQSIEELLSSLGYTSDFNYYFYPMYISLKENVASPRNAKFKIVATLSDRTLEATTSEVVLLN